MAESGVGGTTKATGQQVPPPVGPYMGGKTARISTISPAGMRTTVVADLPSTITSKAVGSEPGGVGDVAFVNGTLYALLSQLSTTARWLRSWGRAAHLRRKSLVTALTERPSTKRSQRPSL